MPEIVVDKHPSARRELQNYLIRLIVEIILPQSPSRFKMRTRDKSDRPAFIREIVEIDKDI